MLEITRRLVELINEKNLTQKDLSMITGLTESTISRYVSGDRIPRGKNLDKLAKALDTSVEDLMGISNINKEKDLKEIKFLIARNSNKMSMEEKMDIINMISKWENK